MFAPPSLGQAAWRRVLPIRAETESSKLHIRRLAAKGIISGHEVQIDPTVGLIGNTIGILFAAHLLPRFPAAEDQRWVRAIRLMMEDRLDRAKVQEYLGGER